MSDTKIIGADEARGLAAKWKGYDGPYAVAPDDQGDYVIHHSEGADMAVARVEDFDEHSEPLARLFASAPDDVKALAATVIAQDADLASLRALVEQHEARAAAHAEERAAMHAEMARLTRERDAALAALVVGGGSAEAWRGLAIGNGNAHAAAVEEILTLRAVIEGRAVAPTDEEIAAHAAARGAWTVARGHIRVVVDVQPEAMLVARLTRAAHTPSSWWPIDSTGRPCAWPVAEVPT